MPLPICVMEDIVGAVDTDEESELRVKNALNATELVFGAWESARSHGRVEFPLEADDNALVGMIEAGDLTPATSDDGR